MTVNQKNLPDAYPKRARPCEGRFLKNGDFVTISGRYVKGPLCPRCGGLMNNESCTSCGGKG